MRKRTKKLKLTRESVRALSSAQAERAVGAMQERYTKTCGCPITWGTCSPSYCQHSVCDSCYDTDCCLMLP